MQTQAERSKLLCLLDRKRLVSNPVVDLVPFCKADDAGPLPLAGVCQQNLFASLSDNPTKTTSAVTTLSVPKSLTHDIQPA
jgi:hypothetical protein